MNETLVHSRFEKLRRRAEEMLSSRGEEKQGDFSEMDILALIHELEVHQIELQLQNEELRSAKVELEESRNRYADLYERAPAGYVDLDRQGLVVQSNLVAREMLGIAVQYQFEYPFTALIHPEDQGKFRALMHRVAQTAEGRGSCEIRITGKNETGAPYVTQMEIAALTDAAGRIERWRVVFVDITVRKQMEEELREARDRLEIRVNERTAELAVANQSLRAEIEDRKQVEAELELYMNKLERSNRELQDFAFIASHDLQEPLRKIQSFGEMLKQNWAGNLGEQGSDFLERMCKAARRLQEMVNGLLDYSRVVTQGKSFEPVDLGKIVREVVSDLEWRIDKNKAEVTVEDLPSIEADPTQMRRLFQNLISNALKFHGNERSVVKIYAKPAAANAEEGNKSRRIFVEDNGIGFEEEDAERIFALFERLHGRSAYEGTGMGLAICKRIVERHGGAIEAHGQPGKGATFVVTLPAIRQGS